MIPQNVKIYPLPSGEYVVSYFDQTRRRRIQEKFQDESAARSFHQDIRGAWAPQKKSHAVTVGGHLREYLDMYPDCYLGHSRKLIREFFVAFELYDPKDLSEIAMRGFLIHLKNEFEYSDRSMLRIKSMLQGFFRFLIEKDVWEQSPLDGIKFDRGAPFRRKPIILAESEIKQILRLAKKFSPALFYPIFLLIHETAAKTSDIESLQWKDLNLKTRVLSLVHSKELQARTFIMSDELAVAISRMHRASAFVFTSLEGKPVRQYILARELKRFQRQVKIETTWGLRDLRASHAANFLRAGGTIEALQKIMGHVRPYQTEEIYGHYRTGDARAFIDPAAVPETEAVSSSDSEF